MMDTRRARPRVESLALHLPGLGHPDSDESLYTARDVAVGVGLVESELVKRG